MTICFFGFSGIDYHEETEAGPRLNRFLCDAQKTIYRYEGSINKLNVGDKGSVLLILFGAPPFVHPDDEARAVACALDLRQVAVEHHVEKAHELLGVLLRQGGNLCVVHGAPRVKRALA